MSTASFVLNQGVSTIYTYTTTFTTIVEWRVTTLTIAAQTTRTAEEISGGAETYVVFTVSNGTDSVNYRHDFDGTATTRITFNAGITVPANGTLTISASGLYAQVYGADMAPEYKAGGYLTSRGAYDMTMNVTYDAQWETDSANDGYPHFIGYDLPNFDFFTKDEDGYPINPQVWKLDNQNDGYPWITGFLEYHNHFDLPRYNTYIIHTTLTPLASYIQTQEGLQRISCYRQTDE